MPKHKKYIETNSLCSSLEMPLRDGREFQVVTKNKNN